MNKDYEDQAYKEDPDFFFLLAKQVRLTHEKYLLMQEHPDEKVQIRLAQLDNKLEKVRNEIMDKTESNTLKAISNV